MKRIKNKFLLFLSKLLLVCLFSLILVVVLVVELISLVDLERGSGVGKTFLDNEIKTVLLGNKNESREGVSSYDFKVLAGDARPLIIKHYLDKYKSPLLPYSDLIFELSQSYGYDNRWIVAIAQQESNLCKKIPKGSYNCWGYGIHSKGTLGFDNYELALRSFAEYLKREYFDKGYDTPELMMKKYCPHSNGSWAFGVKQFFEEMEDGQF